MASIFCILTPPEDFSREGVPPSKDEKFIFKILLNLFKCHLNKLLAFMLGGTPSQRHLCSRESGILLTLFKSSPLPSAGV